jgi:mannose-1-phosphate guanylyltransferase/mannose-6-phosphate isomerase
MSKIIPVILCGGSGSRLWPASRESYPKQFLAFSGGKSLFQDTIARVTGPTFDNPIIVTGADYRFLVAEQVRSAGVVGDLVLEPMRRDSCAAVTAAAEIAALRDPHAIVLVLAADHAIPDTADFLTHVTRGLAGAEAGRIVTFGIKPMAPATGYGYIRPGQALAGIEGVQAIDAFVEKPDKATAERYLSEGYLWNSGNFLFAAGAFLAEVDRLAPDIARPVADAVRNATRDLDFLRLAPDDFARATPKSVDYAVMEKSELAAVVPSTFHWSDIGAWNAIWELAEKDANGNAGLGDAVFFKATNSYVNSPDILTALIGVDNLVVVTTRDAVLVASKDRSEDVKALVTQLSQKNRSEAIEHLRSYRPWGFYERMDLGDRFQVKRITVNPGSKLSLQSHYHRSEHWVVVSGTARVTLDDEIKVLTENQSIYVPLGCKHRIENPGQIPLHLIEVQSGSYLGEDDIVRYEDAYNRM